MSAMTAILTYTPMVEANVSLTRDGRTTAYDLSDDINVRSRAINDL